MNDLDKFPDNFGIITPQDDFYPASGYISHIDGYYTEIGTSMRVFMTYTYPPIGEYVGLGTLLYRALNDPTSGYINSPHAQGLNIRCAKIDYYRPEND